MKAIIETTIDENTRFNTTVKFIGTILGMAFVIVSAFLFLQFRTETAQADARTAIQMVKEVKDNQDIAVDKSATNVLMITNRLTAIETTLNRIDRKLDR